ncbi:MAG: NUDIX domain-containing protein [Opitutales bacterium]
MDPTLIAAYTHCPICGSPEYHLQNGIRRCGACGHTDFNNPISAAAVWIFNEAGELLLIERGHEPGKGMLAPPGGFVDPGESLETTALREIREEVGLELSDLRYLASFPNIYVYKGLGRPVCDIFFTARAKSTRLTLAKGEVDAVQWRKLTEVREAEIAFPSMRKALRVLQETWHG